VPAPAATTVDANTEEVTLGAAGETIITATKAATATHASVSSSYTLTVAAIGSAYQGGNNCIFPSIR